MEFVSIDVTDGVAVLRLDRPKMNAISVQVQADLREAAAELAERDDVRSVVLWGGERVFAAGNDVKEMADLTYSDMVKISTLGQLGDHGHRADPQAGDRRRQRLRPGGRLRARALRRPALRRRGRRLRPARGAARDHPRGRRHPAPHAAGRHRPGRRTSSSPAGSSSADEALRIGMVDRVVPADTVLEEAVAYASQFSGAAALAIRAAKECIDRGSEVDLDTGLEIERQQFAGVFATEDRTHGITSFVENGPGKATFVGR